MDFAIKPISETLFQDNYPFHTISKHIAENQRPGADAELNVGAVQNLPDSVKYEDVPEIGKGGNIDVHG